MPDDRNRPIPRDEPNSIPPPRKPVRAFVTQGELDFALEELKHSIASRLPGLVNSSIRQAVDLAFDPIRTKVDAMAKELAEQKIEREIREKLKREQREEEEHRLKVDSWTSEIDVNKNRALLLQRRSRPAAEEEAEAEEPVVIAKSIDGSFKKKLAVLIALVPVLIALIGLIGAAIGSNQHPPGHAEAPAAESAEKHH